MKNNHFWKHLREYFAVYLPKQRNSSDKTIEACHMAWNLFLRFIIHTRKIDGRHLDFETFTSELLAEFLEQMETEKNWKASTRNQRLSCIRAFFKYASCIDPTAYTVYADLCKIPMKKGTDMSHTVEYMSKEALSALLACADTHTDRGFRDYFFMSLMYDTAARNGEMLKLSVSDLDAANATVYLMGKGSKPRIVPVSKESIAMFTKYRKLFHADGTRESPMFYTKHHGEKTPMSDDNVARFIKKYAARARENNSQVPRNVHPHMFRHSRAMHLYQGGMPLSVLSEFLGHEDPETTLIYAHADTEMKRTAIEQAAAGFIPDDLQGREPVWKDPDIISQLVRGY